MVKARGPAGRSATGLAARLLPNRIRRRGRRDGEAWRKEGLPDSNRVLTILDGMSEVVSPSVGHVPRCSTTPPASERLPSCSSTGSQSKEGLEVYFPRPWRRFRPVNDIDAAKYPAGRGDPKGKASDYFDSYNWEIRPQYQGKRSGFA